MLCQNEEEVGGRELACGVRVSSASTEGGEPCRAQVPQILAKYSRASVALVWTRVVAQVLCCLFRGPLVLRDHPLLAPWQCAHFARQQGRVEEDLVRALHDCGLVPVRREKEDQLSCVVHECSLECVDEARVRVEGSLLCPGDSPVDSTVRSFRKSFRDDVRGQLRDQLFALHEEFAVTCLGHEVGVVYPQPLAQVSSSATRGHVPDCEMESECNGKTWNQREVRGACHLCGQFGHHRRDCRSNKPRIYDRPCFTCGRSGHQIRHCPEPPKEAVALDGAAVPTALPLLPGPETPRSEEWGKWLVVIHTVGLQFCEGATVRSNQKRQLSERNWLRQEPSVRDWLRQAPGNRKGDLLHGAATEQESDVAWDSAVMVPDRKYMVGIPMGFDAHFNFSEDFPITDPVDSEGATGIKIQKRHDGANGVMQYEQLRSDDNCYMIKTVWFRLLQALPAATRAARRRAKRQGKEMSPELHVLVSCRKSRHRAEMLACWMGEAFGTFLDVGKVVIVRHHLRAGPHDDRGRCGCHTGTCILFAKERDGGARAERICASFGQQARVKALQLAASVFNDQFQGPRRLDAPRAWPLVLQPSRAAEVVEAAAEVVEADDVCPAAAAGAPPTPSARKDRRLPVQRGADA